MRDDYLSIQARWWCSLSSVFVFLAFFLYGFGGSIVSDLFMGLPVTALSHARIVPCYLIGWSLVWLFPYDFMFKSYIDSSSSLHYFFQACEAIDSVTTPMGRISRSARELPNNKTADCTNSSWTNGRFRRSMYSFCCGRVDLYWRLGIRILENDFVFVLVVVVGRA